MKKITFLLIALTLGFSSCKKEKKEVKTETEIKETAKKFIIKPDSTTVKWTAYKTSAKKGVGGEFKVLNFDKKTGASVEDALNNLSFSIPVSELFTNDVGRDAKIKMFFFGKMLDTELLKGTIKYSAPNYVAELTMNGVTKDLPLEVTVSKERHVTMDGTINLADWNALEALASLNQICYELHKGEDGISKTWEDVAINVSTYLHKN
jgi:hypothetical protein